MTSRWKPHQCDDSACSKEHTPKTAPVDTLIPGENSSQAMKKLEDLLPGKELSIKDNRDKDIGFPLPPEDFDMDKFHRGRRFFCDNLFSCTVGMFFQLALGLCVPDLLKTLVFTGRSDTPEKAYKRYWATYQHIALWHCGNVWEKGSKAQKSLQSVREVHTKVSKDLVTNGYKDLLSQFNMAIVQCPFLVTPLLYPSEHGMSCTESDLDDYVYFWYGIGWLLGIEDDYNICYHGRALATQLCKEYVDTILHPNLENPTKDFILMSSVFVGAWKSFLYNMMSSDVVMQHYQQVTRNKSIPLGTLDRFRYICWTCLFALVRKISFCKRLANIYFKNKFKLRIYN